MTSGFGSHGGDAIFWVACLIFEVPRLKVEVLDLRSVAPGWI